jgi:ATPase subunit of ABC transporter with duplicated ATPase domains
MSPLESTPTTVTHDHKTIEVLEQNVQMLESTLEKAAPHVVVIEEEVKPVEKVTEEPPLSLEQEAAAYQMSAEEIKAAVNDIIKKKRAAAAAEAKEKSRLANLAVVAAEGEQTEEQVRRLNLIVLHRRPLYYCQLFFIGSRK